MKIDAVECYLLRDQPVTKVPWREGLNHGTDVHDTGWMRVVTDEGVDGWSPFAQGVISADVVKRCLGPIAIGRDPFMRETLWEDVWELDRMERLPQSTMCLLDNALWDLAGRALGQPVWRLLGGARTRVPAYASTATWPTVEHYLERADECLELGYQAIKLHAWADVGRNIDLVSRLRDHVGDGVTLMFDASAGYRYDDALRLGIALERAGYLWYEEPMREYGIAQYARLREKLTIPLLSAEVIGGAHYTSADFAMAGAADILRIGARLKAGITGAMRIAHFADALGMHAEVHGGGLANLHLAVAASNNRFYESLVIGHPAPRGDEDSPLRMDREGYVAAPTAPGIGYDIDPDTLIKAGAEVVRITG